MRITSKQLAEWLEDFYYRHEPLLGVRIGQSFCNYFKIVDPAISAESREYKVFKLIKEKYCG